MSANKTRLARTIAEQTGLSLNRSSKAMASILDLMAASLASGDDVKIAGFGKLYPQTLKARKGRHPKSGKTITIQERRTVRFKCYKKLRDRLNAAETEAPETAHPPDSGVDRRREARMESLPKGKAVVRISGIPVCEFDIKDVSGNGTSILVAEDSVILRNLHLGQDIELHMANAGSGHKAVMQRSKIVHITHQSDDDAYPGHVLVGMKTLSKLI